MIHALPLRKKTLVLFLSVIFFLGLCTTVFGFYVVNRYILGQAQEQINDDLKTVRHEYQRQLDRMKLAFSLVSPSIDPVFVQSKLGLDYFYTVDRSFIYYGSSEIVQEAFRRGYPVGGTRIIQRYELTEINEPRADQLIIPIKYTPKSRQTEKKVVTSAMAIEYARPLVDAAGVVEAVMYGGTIINRNFDFIDGLVDSVFENKMYDGKPVGTVTVFQDDVRIATNVLDNDGQRAIGTRVTDSVYTNVVEHGRQWLDRAFVVTDWYITAYEPISDIYGEIIGILYVGILEKPFINLRMQIFVVFLGIIGVSIIAATIFSFMIADSMVRPIRRMLKTIRNIAQGKMESKVGGHTSIKELNELIDSFDDMASKLAEREHSLERSNEQLAILNKSYLDLIGFVAHELKGILASTILNVFSLQGGFLGLVNFKQRKALDSVAKNLDYLAATVKNFLNLSRIEKGELTLSLDKVKLKADILDEAFEAFIKQADTKRMELVEAIDGEIMLHADTDLMKIVVNNLISNAIKYGASGGQVIVRAPLHRHMAVIEVYNDGVPLNDKDKEKLFRKFSRIITAETKREKGTGLGLFIIKEIITKHGGDIWVETKEKGNSFIFTVPIYDEKE